MVLDNYAKLVSKNLESLYEKLPEGFEAAIEAKKVGKEYFFRAFGKNCHISPHGIYLNEDKQTGVLGILISLYALYANHGPCVLEPFKAFKEFADSMPYVGAFTTHTEQILTPVVHKIKKVRDKIIDQLDGQDSPAGIPGDFSMVLYPFPKIALCYIFYDADEDFQAGVTCLYSSNASYFMPVDGLADVGEYTSKRILEIVPQEK
ncbi:MAG: DUF3786 domain-containing protein [Desulfobacterales bacterium]|nr:DUF3786 domain-containing protein [Desulfobacterales bacterium]